MTVMSATPLSREGQKGPERGSEARLGKRRHPYVRVGARGIVLLLGVSVKAQRLLTGRFANR
jgi:hypothetical protein